MGTQYRFVTKHRTGKWYATIATAQAHACAIGAGFLDHRTGCFVQYAGVLLEELDENREADLAIEGKAAEALS